AIQIVGHVEDHHGRQAETKYGSRERQMPAEVGGIEDKHHRVGTRQIFHLALQNVVSDLLVFGARLEAINAGEIDEKDVAPSFKARASHAVLDCDTGEIGDLLMETSEAIK